MRSARWRSAIVGESFGCPDCGPTRQAKELMNDLRGRDGCQYRIVWRKTDVMPPRDFINNRFDIHSDDTRSRSLLARIFLSSFALGAVLPLGGNSGL
jgi:hypothetical protein